jgi:hypothetical protein
MPVESLATPEDKTISVRKIVYEDLPYSVDQGMEYEPLSQNHNKNRWEKS